MKILLHLLISLMINFCIVANNNTNEFKKFCNFLKNKFGEFGVVVSNPQNGKIKYIYNNNMIMDTQYSPGSLLKVFVIIAYSKTNKINLEETYFCKGYTDEIISCWFGDGHKKLNLIQAVAYSCNYFFYYFIQDKLDRQCYYDTLNDYNLIVYTDYLYGTDYDFYTGSIGLGTKIFLKPINILCAYNALYNGGIIFDTEGNAIKYVNVSDDVLNIIQQGMKECYLYGTAKIVLNKCHILDISGKTGTGIRFEENKRDWKKNIGWVITFNPSINPDFSMLVIVDKTKSSAACELSGELLNFFSKNNNK